MNLKFWNAKSQAMVPEPGAQTIVGKPTEGAGVGTLARAESEALALGRAADRLTFPQTDKPPQVAKLGGKAATDPHDVMFPPRDYSFAPPQDFDDQFLKKITPHSTEPVLSDAELTELKALDARGRAAREGKEKCSMAAVQAEFHRLHAAHEEAVRTGGTPGPFWDHSRYDEEKKKACAVRSVFHGEERSVGVLRREILKRVAGRLESAAWAAAAKELALEQESAARWGVGFEPSVQLRSLVHYARHGTDGCLNFLTNRTAEDLANILR